MHELKIMHRDIKAENIVLIDTPNTLENVKIIDFGMAKAIRLMGTETEVVGSPHYVAPEVLNESYNNKCDLWSIGVLTYFMLTGEPPFDDEDEDVLMEKIKNEELKINPKLFKGISLNAKEFVMSLLKKNPSERPSATNALKHDWFKHQSEIKVDEDQTRNALANLKNYKKKKSLGIATMNYIGSQVLSSKQCVELTKVFRSLDKNQNGMLNKSEVRQGYEMFGMVIDDDQLEKLFLAVDTAKNGHINYTEFLIAASEQDNLMCTNNLEAAFAKFSDENGFIRA